VPICAGRSLKRTRSLGRFLQPGKVLRWRQGFPPPKDRNRRSRRPVEGGGKPRSALVNKAKPPLPRKTGRQGKKKPQHTAKKTALPPVKKPAASRTSRDQGQGHIGLSRKAKPGRQGSRIFASAKKMGGGRQEGPRLRRKSPRGQEIAPCRRKSQPRGKKRSPSRKSVVAARKRQAREAPVAPRSDSAATKGERGTRRKLFRRQGTQRQARSLRGGQLRRRPNPRTGAEPERLRRPGKRPDPDGRPLQAEPLTSARVPSPGDEHDQPDQFLPRAGRSPSGSKKPGPRRQKAATPRSRRSVVPLVRLERPRRLQHGYGFSISAGPDAKCRVAAAGDRRFGGVRGSRASAGLHEF